MEIKHLFTYSDIDGDVVVVVVVQKTVVAMNLTLELVLLDFAVAVQHLNENAVADLLQMFVVAVAIKIKL